MSLSTDLQSLEQTSPNAAKSQFFEQHVTEAAYQAFGARFPDLVESVVTYKTVTSDPDMGTALGAFILDLSGETGYVPVSFHEDEVQPIDILYLVNQSKFVPMTKEWVVEAQRGAPQSLGEGTKLPQTVPTDMDIRNLVVPPTTGRYSYASLQEVPAEKRAAWREDADATVPLARAIVKRAEAGFDPAMWEGFVSTYAQMNGVTPGNALDQGQVDIDSLAKMYKSHAKTWSTPMQAPPAQPQAAATPVSAPQGAASAPAAPTPMGGGFPGEAPKMANVATDAARAAERAAGGATERGLFSQVGGKADDLAGHLAESAALGAAGGAMTGVYDQDYGSIGDRALHGAIGGAVGGGLGRTVGHGLNARHSELQGYGDELGHYLGTALGTLTGARPGTISSMVPGNRSMQQDPYGGMYRYAEDRTDLTPMLKHALEEPHERPLRLLDYLNASPNSVKTAFALTLRKHVSLLKFAANIYGEDELVAALRPRAEKTAGVSELASKGLRVTDTTTGSTAFGAQSPLAFRGVALRGYYFDDKRKARNALMVQQEYHDAVDAREPGVYKLWKLNGKQVPALVIQNPLDLLEHDRQTFPKNVESRVEVSVNSPGGLSTNPEPDSTANARYPDHDVERSHKCPRMIIFGNGEYMTSEELFGERVLENALEGSAIYNRIYTDKPAVPKQGTGMFVWRRGANVYGTKPVTLSNIATASDGVVSGKIQGAGGWGRSKMFKIDPRSPMSRALRPRGEAFVVLPAEWAWVPLKGEIDQEGIILRGSSVIDIALNGLQSMGSHKVLARSAGANMHSIDARPEMKKVSALKFIADTYDVSGSDAEALLKIAELEGVAHAWVVPRKLGLDKLGHARKVAAAPGEEGDETSAPAAAAPAAPPATPAPAAAAAPAAPMEAAPSPVDQAFGEALTGLEQQMQTLQGQLSVLQSVQQRAQQLAGGAGEDPTSMQSTDPVMAPSAPAPAPEAAPAPEGGAPASATAGGMDPGVGMDPAAMGGGGMDPAMAGGDPAMAGGMQPPPVQLPSMPTEGPTSSEIASEINPTFLQEAAGMQHAGIFDVAAITDLENAAQRAGRAAAAPLGDHTTDLDKTVDDLGRTLLMLQIRAPELEEQLGTEAYKSLEDQARNTFLSLGQLQLALQNHSTSLTDAQGSLHS